MIKFWREINVPWGESDPFGLVYYPRMVAWFNDTEHELFRHIGYPIEKMIEKIKQHLSWVKYNLDLLDQQLTGFGS